MHTHTQQHYSRTGRRNARISSFVIPFLPFSSSGCSFFFWAGISVPTVFRVKGPQAHTHTHTISMLMSWDWENLFGTHASSRATGETRHRTARFRGPAQKSQPFPLQPVRREEDVVNKRGCRGATGDHGLPSSI